jgi:hypothetical protein
MKPDILLISPMLPAIDEALCASYIVHRYYEQDDKHAYIREVGHAIRGS